MTVRERQVQDLWKRAQDSATISERVRSDGYPDFAASHAYYTAFYAASALLLSASIQFSKHRSVISAIHKENVKAGKLPKEAGRIIASLFELRGVADYGGSRHVTATEAAKAVREAKEFMELVRPLVPLK